MTLVYSKFTDESAGERICEIWQKTKLKGLFLCITRVCPCNRLIRSVTISFQSPPRKLILRRPPPKWPILCRVGRYILLNPIQLMWRSRTHCKRSSIYSLCAASRKLLSTLQYRRNLLASDPFREVPGRGTYTVWPGIYMRCSRGTTTRTADSQMQLA